MTHHVRKEFPSGLRAQAEGNLLNCIKGIEDFYAVLAGTSETQQATFDPVALGKSPSSEYVTKALEILLAIYSAKYLELVGAAIESVGRSDFLVFAYCGRGVIETTATLNYYNNELLKLLSAVKNPDAWRPEELVTVARLLDTHSRGGRFDWTAFWTDSRKDLAQRLVERRKKDKRRKNKEGDGKDGENGRKEASTDSPDGQVSQVNIQTAMDHWMKEEPGVALFYEFFCELVHPNLGSNFLVMSADEGHLGIGHRGNKAVGRSIVREGILFLGPVVKTAARQMAVLTYWSGLTKTSGDAEPQDAG